MRICRFSPHAWESYCSEESAANVNVIGLLTVCLYCSLAVHWVLPLQNLRLGDTSYLVQTLVYHGSGLVQSKVGTASLSNPLKLLCHDFCVCMGARVFGTTCMSRSRLMQALSHMQVMPAPSRANAGGLCQLDKRCVPLLCTCRSIRGHSPVPDSKQGRCRGHHCVRILY